MNGRARSHKPGNRPSRHQPTKRRPAPIRGRFGEYGGRYVPETLVAAIDELEEAYARIAGSREFRSELDGLLHSYAGRPTPLSFARRISSSNASVSFASVCHALFRTSCPQ